MLPTDLDFFSQIEAVRATTPGSEQIVCVWKGNSMQTCSVVCAIPWYDRWYIITGSDAAQAVSLCSFVRQQ